MKYCKDCDTEKDLSSFYIRGGKPISQCKSCRKLYKATHYKANKKTINAKKIEHYNNNREEILVKCKAYTKNNWQQHLDSCKKYRDSNKSKINALTAARYASKTSATPFWADKELIKDIYVEARYQGMQVDHIVPLRSDKVCGLHWEGNMQLLSAKDNQSKSNYYWEDM